MQLWQLEVVGDEKDRASITTALKSTGFVWGVGALLQGVFFLITGLFFVRWLRLVVTLTRAQSLGGLPASCGRS